MHNTSMGHLRVNSSDMSRKGSSISINSSGSGISSDSGNSTSRTIISSTSSSSLNSGYPSSVNSSRNGSISSGSSKNSSRALAKTSITLIRSASSSSLNSGYPSSVNSSRNGSISSGSSKNSSRALAKTSIASTTSLLAEDADDSSNLVNIGSMSNGFISRVTVPFVPTHGCNIVPGKTGSLFIDTYNTTRMYMDKGKDDKVYLNDKLHSPIWITPSTGNHTCLNGEACQTEHCKCSLGNYTPYPPERRPDFTLMHSYRSPKPPQRCRCKCGTITTLTCIFSIVMLLLILGFVIYNETVMKNPRVRIYYKM